MAKRLTVSQLNGYMKQMFQDEMLLHNIEVIGEVSEFSVSGNMTYITLRENDFLLSCIKFSTHEPLPIGTSVIAQGSIGFYEKGGRISFTIKSIVPTGEGKHYLKLQQIKKQLLDEGVFSQGKELPFYISKIAIITSATGAVIHDFRKVLLDGGSQCDIILYNSKVQGEGADKEIANAILTTQSWAKDCDCLVIMRGGGSGFDLDTFNSELLARAVAVCSLPVISAIGHEIDNTLCDLCAKTRAGTPSIAAEIICSNNKKVKERLISAIESLKLNLNTLLKEKSLRLERIENKIIKAAQLRVAVCENSIIHFTRRMKQGLNDSFNRQHFKTINLTLKIKNSINRLINKNEQKISKLELLLDKNSPIKILKRGYARVYKDNNVISEVANLKIGDSIQVFMQDGNIISEVKNKQKGHN